MTASDFLDPRLESDSVAVLDLPLCTVRLARDANYPWLILVPRVTGLIEIIDLTAEDRSRLMEEIARAGIALREVTGCHKLNVAALGNQVPQLHVHIIGRFEDDAAWPGPVWGAVPPVAYDGAARDQLITKLVDRLSN